MIKLSPVATGVAIGCSLVFVAPASSQSIDTLIDRQATNNELSDDRSDDRLISFHHRIPEDSTTVDTSPPMGTPNPLPLERYARFRLSSSSGRSN